VVVYKRRLHLIDLFVTGAASPGGNSVPSPTMHPTPSGYNAEHWAQDGQDYWAVSDLNREELEEFTKSWLQSQ